MTSPLTLESTRNDRRVRITVEGTVQGVGFRPFVFRFARSLGLGGHVCNDGVGVSIELEGASTSIDHFVDRFAELAPRHARIARVAVRDLQPTGRVDAFRVETSRESPLTSASVPPDISTCDECLRELFDPANRRHRYPFINCTICGPRFTIARRIPYDRESTTMAAFIMCASCQAEYDDPGDRRFQAQANACPTCGPRVELVDVKGIPVSSSSASDPVAAAVDALRAGAIVAVKGLGGFHIACRADDESVVARLRRRKQRDDKPLAIMAKDVSAARNLVRLDALECGLMTSEARPIVLARKIDRARVATEVARGRRDLGVMLPYTPLHHLLMAALEMPLVMTSGNLSDEPIAYRDGDALERLGTIADLVLTHDRLIAERCEDSVVRVARIAGAPQPLFVRRSRGYVPQPVSMPVAASEPILAVGGQLKNTVCVVRGASATVGPHGGDLGDAGAFAAFARSVEHLVALVGASATVVAHDQHPEYESTKYALHRVDLQPMGVQHHHAHLAACLAEHGETSPAIGLIFDGAGYGADGTIWGGEILVGDIGEFTRIGHLRGVRMPGGEVSVREPWRMACAWLTDANDGEPMLCTRLRGTVSEKDWTNVSRLSRLARHSPLTTSVGRLLDACAAICGLGARVTYEGQAAIELEESARAAGILESNREERYPVAVSIVGEIVIDPRELILAVERDANAGRALADISSCVHRGLIYAAELAAQLASERTGSRTIVLSGGVFQNVLLVESLSSALARSGMRVLVPRQLPPNDGGLAYGQAVVAAWQRRTDVPGHSGASR